MAVIRKNVLSFKCGNFAKRYPDHEANDLLREAEGLIADMESELEELRAARQPVGQEPVAVVGSDFTICWLGSGPIAPLVERHGIKRGGLLYAAPPAQAVDLGQFRELAQRWADKAVMAPSPMTARSCSQQLLALIDGKAVQS